MKRLKTLLLLFFFGIIALVTLLPFFSVLLSSLVRPELALSHRGVLTIPFPISFKQYVSALFYTKDTLRYFWNTVIYTAPTLCGGMGFALLSGYGLAKFEFPFKKTLLFSYIMLMLLPVQIQLVGTYLFYDRVQLLGKYIGVILPGIFSPFGAFLIYQFMKKVPDNTLESARLEGAGEFTVFIKIVLPQVRSGIASMLILMLIECWNMVEMPMTLLGDEGKYPLAIMLRALDPDAIGVSGQIYAATILFTIPLLLVFFMAGDSLTDGIEQSNFIK